MEAAATAAILTRALLPVTRLQPLLNSANPPTVSMSPPSLASPELSAIMSRAPSLGDTRSAASSLLAPAISAVIERLGTLVEHAVIRDAVCQSLEAQCADLESQLRAAQANIHQQKAAQRRLRADIAAFIRERGKTRCAGK